MLSIVVVAINIYFVVGKLMEQDLDISLVVVICIVAVFYFIFIVYLTVHLYLSMKTQDLELHPTVEKFIMVPTALFKTAKVDIKSDP